MGNAAVSAIREANAHSEQQQARSSASPLAADNPNTPVNPVWAYLNGPYANMDDAAGVSDAQIAAYMSSGLPMLASIGNATTFAAVNGGGSGPVDVTESEFLSDPQRGALAQLDYDAKWMKYAQAMEQQPDGVADAASIKAAQEAYNAAASSDTAANNAQYDPTKVQELNDALNEMIQQNGWSFGSPQNATSDQVQTLPTITVTATATPDSSASAYGMQSYAAATSSANNPGSLGTFATGFSLVGDTAEAGGLLGVTFGKSYGISIDWGNPTGYDSVLLNNGGKLPPWLAGPEIKNINIGTDAGALRGADYVVDLSKLSKVGHLLERGGNLFGVIGVALDWGSAARSGEPNAYVHAGVDTLVFGGALLVGGLPGVALGIGWTVLDEAMSHYTYNGQKGWGAALNAAGDALDKEQKAGGSMWPPMLPW